MRAGEARLRHDDSLLATPRIWPGRANPVLGIQRAKLTTQFDSGVTRFHMVVQPVPSGYPANANAYVLKFTDSAGFDVLSRPLLPAELVRLVDSTGKPTALSAQGEIWSLERGAYARLAGWSLAWQRE